MADTPRIEKYSDAGTYVDLPGFTVRSPSHTQDAAFVRFEGDTRPRTYIGEGYDVVWQVNGVFNARIAAQLTLLEDLKDILDEVHASSDRRLKLTVGGVLETLYPSKVTVALDGAYPISQPTQGSGIFSINMTLREVIG